MHQAGGGFVSPQTRASWAVCVFKLEDLFATQAPRGPEHLIGNITGAPPRRRNTWEANLTAPCPEAPYRMPA